MKKIVLTALAFAALVSAQAQLKQGTISYERTNTFEAHLNINGMEQVMPQTRKQNFELLFTSSQTLWKAAEQDNNDDMGSSEGGMQIHMIIIGSNDVLFTNLDSKTKVEKREVLDKNFIVDDSVKILQWKMTGETKTILDHNCMKATATQIRKSTKMTNDNGVMERKEVTDTMPVVAWFATDIPIATGPAEFQAQLPGIILEMDINNGKQLYKATAIKEKVDVADIKAPTGKKHYTPDEFKKESDKLMQEMQRNMQSGPGGFRTKAD
ncbi:MAG: GLPGLI family protein [Bacteroidetes bacterium]|nr:GLPGLI family protein [Bacteroidota bacterium]